MKPTPRVSSPYRSELDGLRALAVLEIFYVSAQDRGVKGEGGGGGEARCCVWIEVISTMILEEYFEG